MDTEERYIQIHQERIDGLVEALSSVLKTTAKLRPLREEVLQHRSLLDRELEASIYPRDYFTQTRQKFVEHASLFRQSSSSESISTFDDLARGLSEDHSTLAQHEDRVRNAQQNVSRIEYKMQKRESKLQTALLRLTNTIEECGLGNSDEYEIKSGSRVTTQADFCSRAASPRLDPLLLAYYDKAGDVKIMRERLCDLEREYHEAISFRLMQQDQDVLLEDSDAEFHDHWQQLFDSTDAEHEEAIKAATRARQSCSDNGVPIPPENLHPEGDSWRLPLPRPALQELPCADSPSVQMLSTLDEYSTSSGQDPAPVAELPLRVFLRSPVTGDWINEQRVSSRYGLRKRGRACVNEMVKNWMDSGHAHNSESCMPPMEQVTKAPLGERRSASAGPERHPTRAEMVFYRFPSRRSALRRSRSWETRDQDFNHQSSPSTTQTRHIPQI